MCATCGCDSDKTVTLLKPGEENSGSGHHHHHHDHDHHGHHHHDHDHHHDHHSHEHIHTSPEMIQLEKDVLLKNDLLAERNRGFLEARNIFAVNMVSSPGSGKTTLLEKTITMLKGEISISVIEGDQQTSNDADRINATGAEVVQVNTGKGCHLDSEMVNMAIKKLQPVDNSVLFIENVGNLVCPSLFDLGEQKRVVIISVTEGEDKPLKYPTMFETADVCVINKTDLLPYIDFDLDKLRDYARRINPELRFFEVSATKGQGMEEWCSWVKDSILIKE